MNASSSKLSSLLRDWKFAEAVPVGWDWVDQLSGSLGPVDAITLSAALQGIRYPGMEHPHREATTNPANLEADVNNVRADVIKAMAPAKQAKSRDMRSSAPIELAHAAQGTQADYAAYRQRYTEVQRRMEWRIDPLREHCRQTLSKSNSRLRKLAELDATMENIFGAREKALFSKLAVILERRFEDLKRQHQNTPGSVSGEANAASEEVPALQPKSAAWVAKFEKDFEALVRAELDVRLGPIAGMMEAYGNETLTDAENNTLNKVKR